MFDLDFTELVMRIAIAKLQRGYALNPWEVDDLKSLYCLDCMPKILSEYISGYRPSRSKKLRGRPRKHATDAGEKIEYEMLAEYWLAKSAPGTGKLFSTKCERVLTEMRKKYTQFSSDGGLLNKVTGLRFHADEKFFWEYVLSEHGLELARRMLQSMNPDGLRLRRKLRIIIDEFKEVDRVVANHKLAA